MGVYWQFLKCLVYDIMKNLKLNYLLQRKNLMILLISISLTNLFCLQIVSADGVQFTPPPSNGMVSLDAEQQSAVSENLGNLLTMGQYIVNGLIGVGLLLTIVGFVKTAFQLGKGSARERPEAMRNLIVLAGTTAGLGCFPWILTLIIAILNF